MDYMPVGDKTKQAVGDRIRAAEELNTDYQSGKGLIPFTPTEYNLESQVQDAAIKQKANNRYQNELQRIQTQQKFSQGPKAIAAMQQAIQTQSSLSALDQARQRALKKRLLDEEAQRAQVLSSLLGAGAIIGGTVAGGPAGGVAAGTAVNAGTQVAQSQQRQQQMDPRYRNNMSSDI